MFWFKNNIHFINLWQHIISCYYLKDSIMSLNDFIEYINDKFDKANNFLQEFYNKVKLLVNNDIKTKKQLRIINKLINN